MRGQSRLTSAARGIRPARAHGVGISTRRYIQISATPTTGSPAIGTDPLSSFAADQNPADARFEVLGAPYSLLQVSLSASQKLYTRRGTLVGVSGKAENAQSTLSMLEPFRRAALGIPFLYQRISSTSPLTALISTKTPTTSFTVVHLNGTTDWMIAQRKALLAWTGHTLAVTPAMNRSMSIAHWGNTEVTGRGLVALAGPGQTYQISLKAGEEYVAHPGNVVAYTITQHPPLPYRLKSSSLRFQIPSVNFSRFLPDMKFFRVMKESTTLKYLSKIMYSLRTSARRTIWGDSLFLKFHGPTTILISSRASHISDVLTNRDINEIADSEAGAVQSAITLESTPKAEIETKPATSDIPTGFRVATVGKEGKVQFEDAESLESLKK